MITISKYPFKQLDDLYKTSNNIIEYYYCFPYQK